MGEKQIMTMKALVISIFSYVTDIKYFTSAVFYVNNSLILHKGLITIVCFCIYIMAFSREQICVTINYCTIIIYIQLMEV